MIRFGLIHKCGHYYEVQNKAAANGYLRQLCFDGCCFALIFGAEQRLFKYCVVADQSYIVDVNFLVCHFFRSKAKVEVEAGDN